MFNTKYFRFNGIDSEGFFADDNMYLVKKDSTSKYSFAISRKMVQDYGQNRTKPFLYGFTEDPLVIKMRIAKEKEWTFDERKELINWLYNDNYKELLFYNEDIYTEEEYDEGETPTTNGVYDIAFYCIATGSPSFNSIGTEFGYVDIEFTCDAPHGWTIGDSISVHNVDDNTFTLSNLSNVRDFIFPELEIEIPDVERRTVESVFVQEDQYGDPYVTLDNWPPAGSDITVTKDAVPNVISNPTLDGNILYLPLTYSLGDDIEVDYEDYTITLLNQDDLRYFSDDVDVNNAAKRFVVSGLLRGETIKIDCENKLISSDLGIARVSNFNKHWLRLYKGINTITVGGAATITATIKQPIGI